MNPNKIMIATFRGVGQVMFQNNALSGVLMLIGIGCNSMIMCFFALLGTIISTLTAIALKYDRENIENGLYGFNGTLVAIAVPCFMPINIWSVLIMVIASLTTTLVAHAFERQKYLPSLTAPFVIITWIMLLMSRVLPVLQQSGVAVVETEEPFSLFQAVSFNFGQIMLQGKSIFTGIFFFLALLINSRKMALESFVASLLSLMVLITPFVETHSVNSGMYGYNAILTLLAIANILNTKSCVYIKALVGLGLSVIIQFVGLNMGIVTLTAPFVLSVWLIALYNSFELYRSRAKVGRSKS